jgi:hypothetical protein
MLPLLRSLIVIFLVTFFVSGGGALLFWGYQQVMISKEKDPNYNLHYIEQEALEGQPFRTIHLGQLLGINNQEAINLYRFDTEAAAKLLLSSWLFRSVAVWKRFPDTLHMEYLPRIPYAYLADYENTAFDEEGYLFPMKPFYTPKRLPKIYLGQGPQLLSELGSFQEGRYRSYPWGGRLTGKKLELAKELISYFNNKHIFPNTYVKWIDLSFAHEGSWSSREIILELEIYRGRYQGETQDPTTPIAVTRTLRLSHQNYLRQLASYRTLAIHLDQRDASKTLIDLRIDGLAFFREKEFGEALKELS